MHKFYPKLNIMLLYGPVTTSKKAHCRLYPCGDMEVLVGFWHFADVDDETRQHPSLVALAQIQISEISLCRLKVCCVKHIIAQCGHEQVAFHIGFKRLCHEFICSNFFHNQPYYRKNYLQIYRITISCAPLVLRRAKLGVQFIYRFLQFNNLPPHNLQPITINHQPSTTHVELAKLELIQAHIADTAFMLISLAKIAQQLT